MIIELNNVATQVEDSEANTSDCLANFVINTESKTLVVNPAYAYFTSEVEKIISSLDLDISDESAVVNEESNTTTFTLI